MDTTPLTQKTAYSTDTSIRPVASQSSAGNVSTQTAGAVQALEKSAAGQSRAQSEQKETQLSAEQLTEMAEQMDEFVGTFNRGLKFRVDEDSGRNVVSVVDTSNGEVVRQIPTEELLQVISRLAEASGGLIDVKA
ncbi:flagellar protein FlaG [Oceanimonas sp. CAM02]|uniref:flagellar protein FlaG n=1 Tax=Oceanimonas sp. CAM02 TaxID=3080336 RepID=UPI0029354DAF|nr:flagellar protein FlaG [Oceanimonas sp. CAM02]MDV2856434.1 flagellar protein FlaG [Oceanimonas sp. CAM02]